MTLKQAFLVLSRRTSKSSFATDVVPFGSGALAEEETGVVPAEPRAGEEVALPRFGVPAAASMQTTSACDELCERSRGSSALT